MAPRVANNALFVVFCVNPCTDFSKYCLTCISLFVLDIIHAKLSSSMFVTSFSFTIFSSSSSNAYINIDKYLAVESLLPRVLHNLVDVQVVAPEVL